MEDQNTEWKETWHDEYLKSVCGFANAQGGAIEIGRNNKGVITGVVSAERLLDELPKKIRATMGIVADVNLRRKNAHPPTNRYFRSPQLSQKKRPG
jgi:ATP-dependent DNA helicase RecG